MLPPVRTPSIDLDNVRSNLSKGAGGALSPVAILSPAGQRGGLDLFPGGAAKARGLIEGFGGNDPRAVHPCHNLLPNSLFQACKSAILQCQPFQLTLEVLMGSAHVGRCGYKLMQACPAGSAMHCNLMRTGLSYLTRTGELLKAVLAVYRCSRARAVRLSGYWRGLSARATGPPALPSRPTRSAPPPGHLQRRHRTSPKQMQR